MKLCHKNNLYQVFVSLVSLNPILLVYLVYKSIYIPTKRFNFRPPIKVYDWAPPTTPKKRNR